MNLTAQKTYEQESQLWTGIALNKDLKKNWQLGVQYQVRLDENISRFKGSYFFVNPSYRINKYLSTELEYRYVTSYEQDLHRLGIGLTGRYKKKKWVFTNRLIFQKEYEYFNDSYQDGHKPTSYLRNRFRVNYTISKRLAINISSEPFFKLSYKGNKMDRIRNMISVEYDFSKRHKIQLGYIFQPEINQSSPKMTHIPVVMYQYDIPKFKKKKKKD